MGAPRGRRAPLQVHPMYVRAPVHVYLQKN
jgi:hypothetical protein